MANHHTASHHSDNHVAPNHAVRLAELLPDGVPNPELANCVIQSLAIDSRNVQTGSLFFALKGSVPTKTAEEHYLKMATFIQSALDKGASVVLSEVPAATLGLDAEHIIYLADLRQQIGPITRRFNQLTHPISQPVRVAAVTGTNGKTTTTRLIAELLTLAGHASAVLGTTGNGILPHLEASSHTTLDALQLQNHLHDYASKGAVFASLEASSHGLEQGRLAGTSVEVALFTNLTRDHLDYHGTFEAYAEAKSRLFNPQYFPELSHVVLNADDPASDLMLSQQTKALTIWRYSTKYQAELPDNSTTKADFYVTHAEFTLKGATLDVQTPFGAVTLHSPLLGRFNVANLLGAIAGALALGLTLNQIVEFVPLLVGAPGRMQVITDESLLLIVDYAHTPDAVTQILTSLRPHTTGQLTCVIGCGGDRDRGKRPLMTRAALDLADRVIVTSDNPRSEAIDSIIADMLHDLNLDDLSKISVEPDRRQAILQAVRESHAGDAVVVAGKGHEDYQEINGVKHWFDDAVELAQARAALGVLPAVADASQNG